MPLYYLSLGSNINPEINIPRMIQELLILTSQITISRIIRTEPVDIMSDHYFLNLCACLEVDISQDNLKQVFNHIETKLGRDRTDDNRSKKDRTADIDILFRYENQDITIDAYPDYVKLPLIDLLQYQNTRGFATAHVTTVSGVKLQLGQLQIGQQPITIAYDSTVEVYSLIK